MDEKDIQAINNILKSFNKKVLILEWGSGHSTIYFTDMMRKKI